MVYQGKKGRLEDRHKAQVVWHRRLACYHYVTSDLKALEADGGLSLTSMHSQDAGYNDNGQI